MQLRCHRLEVEHAELWLARWLLDQWLRLGLLALETSILERLLGVVAQTSSAQRPRQTMLLRQAKHDELQDLAPQPPLLLLCLWRPPVQETASPKLRVQYPLLPSMPNTSYAW